MPIDPSRLCSCHGEPMVCQGNRSRCVVKRRITTSRYQATPKGREAKLRATQHYNSRRVCIGGRILFAASTRAEAERLNAHIKGRMREFKQGQSAGAEAKGCEAGAV
jgi:hypothetical protein